MIIAVVPIVLAILGALLYALAANPKVSEMGRIAYFCGLLALAFTLGREVFHIG